MRSPPAAPMFKTLTQTTRLLSESFSQHYLITQSPLASAAMLLAQPLMQTAGRYLRCHSSRADKPRVN